MGYRDNEFIYWKDAKSAVTDMVMENVMDLTASPVMEMKKSDGNMMTLQEIANHNSLTAMFNDGVLAMAKAVLRGLKDSDGDGDE